MLSDVKCLGAGLQELHSTSFQSHPGQRSNEEHHAGQADDLLADGFHFWDGHQQWQQQPDGNQGAGDPSQGFQLSRRTQK